MQVSFVAGFNPVVPDTDSSRAFWGAGLGIQLEEAAPGYWATDHLEGLKAFALWPLAQAAESCFGTSAWPSGPSPAAMAGQAATAPPGSTTPTAASSTWP